MPFLFVCLRPVCDAVHKNGAEARRKALLRAHCILRGVKHIKRLMEHAFRAAGGKSGFCIRKGWVKVAANPVRDSMVTAIADRA